MSEADWSDVVADIMPILEMLMTAAGALLTMAAGARIAMWGFAAKGAAAAAPSAPSQPPSGNASQHRTPPAPTRPKRAARRCTHHDDYDDHDSYDDWDADDDWDIDDDEGDWV